MISLRINSWIPSGYRSVVPVVLLALGGCFPEDPIVREPSKETLPSLLCAPFVTTGYTQKLSFLPGERMQVFVETSQPVTGLCRLDLFNLNGDIVFSSASLLPAVPVLPVDASADGYNYPIAVELIVPALKSGIYLIENKIPFIVKTDRAVDVMIVYPSNTANAYALSGGKNLYTLQGRPSWVSFQRPIALQSLSQFCLKWFNALENISIGYIADIDMDRFENISGARILVIPGHSEYWTKEARQNFDLFVNLGSDALVLSGNTMWWQVRYSEDQSKMICYKDSLADPVDNPLQRTVEWNLQSLQYSILSSIGADFPHGGYGLRADAGWDGFKVATPASPLFEGVDLKKGDIISVPTTEYDGAPVSGYDEEGYPIIDSGVLGFEKMELLGFDKGFRVRETAGTFIIFRKSLTSGVVVNTGTTDWCSANGMGGQSGNEIKEITYNALTKLLNRDPVFSQ
jgi:hypothetical protein